MNFEIWMGGRGRRGGHWARWVMGDAGFRLQSGRSMAAERGALGALGYGFRLQSLNGDGATEAGRRREGEGRLDRLARQAGAGGGSTGAFKDGCMGCQDINAPAFM